MFIVIAIIGLLVIEIISRIAPATEFVEKYKSSIMELINMPIISLEFAALLILSLVITILIVAIIVVFIIGYMEKKST